MRFCVFPTGGAVLKELRLAQPSFLCTHFPFPAVNKEAGADLQRLHLSPQPFQPQAAVPT